MLKTASSSFTHLRFAELRHRSSVWQPALAHHTPLAAKACRESKTGGKKVYCINQSLCIHYHLYSLQGGFSMQLQQLLQKGRWWCSDGRCRWPVQKLRQPLGGAFCKPAPAFTTPFFIFKARNSSKPGSCSHFFQHLPIITLSRCVISCQHSQQVLLSSL